MTPDELVSAYVDAFNAGDRSGCLELYAEDASVHFMAAAYRGHAAIRQWLEQRFAAGAQIVKVNGVEAAGDTITIHAAVTSRKLQAWRLGTINGRAEVRLDAEHRIAECRLGWDGIRPASGGT
jgi:hypothetical protein